MKILVEVNGEWVKLRGDRADANKIICSLNRQQIDAIFYKYKSHSYITSNEDGGVGVYYAVKALMELNLIKYKQLEYCDACSEETDEWVDVVVEPNYTRKFCKKCLEFYCEKCKTCGDYKYKETFAVIKDKHGQIKMCCHSGARRQNLRQCPVCKAYHPNSTVLCKDCAEKYVRCGSCNSYVLKKDFEHGECPRVC